ncbi:MAG: Xaa-Pro peptidase family protein, partial [Acetobacteraceae bacterium]|nr:Xaa-Pro peptidase family protein [Acetobacteraceae bacterium]
PRPAHSSRRPSRPQARIEGGSALLDDCLFRSPPREETARHKFKQLQQEMKARGFDAVILNRSDNVRLVTGVMPTDSLVFSHRQAAIVLSQGDSPILFGASHYVDKLQGELGRKFWIRDVRALPRIQDTWAALFHAALKEYGVRRGRVGLDPQMFYKTARAVERELKEYEVVDASEPLARVRMIKTPEEIRVIDEACSLGELGLEAGWRALRPGVTENELAAVISQACLAAGAEALYSTRGTLLVSGPRLSYQQECASSYRIRQGDFVFVDVGPLHKGYYCDLARTVLLGSPTAEQKRLYTAAYLGLQAAIRRVRPGLGAEELHRAALEVLRSAGHAEDSSSFVGHGVGVCAQEPPWYVRGEMPAGREDELSLTPDRLEAGMVLALSTGVFRPGVAGVRFEEVVAVTETGHRVLSRASYPGLEEMIEGAGAVS